MIIGFMNEIELEILKNTLLIGGLLMVAYLIFKYLFRSLYDYLLNFDIGTVCFALIVAQFIFISYFTDRRDVIVRNFIPLKLAALNNCQAEAEKQTKMPYGVKLYIKDRPNRTYRLYINSHNDEFIEKVNSGYTVSKMRNSTDILLINGSDSVYYNLYY